MKECVSHHFACECREALLASQLRDAIAALELIAAPKRPDGTYNRCREACEQLARETLEKLKGN